MMRRFRDLSFSSKFRFWVITIAILVGIGFVSAITWSIFRGDGIKANAEGFGAKGGIEIGRVKK